MSLRENLFKIREKSASRLDRQDMAPLKPNLTRIQASPIIISWDLLRLYNKMFGKCPLDKELLTEGHAFDIKVPYIEELMQKSFLIEKNTKRKGRIYKLI